MLVCLVSDLSLLGTSGSHMMHTCAGVAKAQLNFSSTLYKLQFTGARTNFGHLDNILKRRSLSFWMFYSM